MIEQVLQLSAAQLEHALPPPTGAVKPSAPFVKLENADRTRPALCPLEHFAGSLERLIGRSSSNFSSQVGQ